MISNMYSILLMMFSLENAFGIETSDIYDIHQIKRYHIGITAHLIFNHHRNSWPTNIDERNEALKMVMINLARYLEDLNSIASDVEDNYWSNDFYRFIKTMEEHQIKNGYSGSFFDLEKYMRLIEINRDAIDSAVRTVLYFREHNYFNDTVYLCPYFLGLLQSILYDHYDQSILGVYQNFLRTLITKISIEDQHDFCGKTSSFRVELFNFYRLVMTPYLKAFVIVTFTKTIEMPCQNRTTANLFYSKLEENIVGVLQLTKTLLYHISHYTYRCDVKYSTQYNKNSYYHELEKMIQTVIVEERAISSVGSCSFNCDLQYTYGQINHKECFHFYNCQYITNGYNVCRSSNTSSRRYEWFKDKNGVVYGNSNHGSCLNKIESIESFYNAAQLRQCDYCVCTCVTNPFYNKAHVAFISFREQVSNIDENMVVVGVRFAKKDNMIHVQIKEGKLHPNGLISDSKWKKLEDIFKDDETLQFHVIINETHSEELKWGVDYGFPEMINFDDVFAPKVFAITGVRLRFAEKSPDNPEPESNSIELQIRISPIDFIKGKIYYNSTYWKSVEKGKPRSELILIDPDKPNKLSGNSIVSKNDQFIRFQATNLKKDAGQSTVPFFDAQDVEGDPEFPLGGIGLILRGRQNDGGFLAFRIFDLELFQYLQTKDNVY